MKQIKPLFFAPVLFFLVLIPATRTFSREVFTTGLLSPTKIITAGQSHLLVTETGTAVANSGRISLVNRVTGARRTLIDGLPSAFNSVEQAPSGPSGLKLVGLTLYITIGQGDSVIRGGRGGTVVNPNPATPLNNSVLELILPADYEVLASGFVLSLDDQNNLAKSLPVSLQNTEGKTMNLRLVANLPDWKMENLPGLPQGNVRPANLFGVESRFSFLYVVDASFNQLYLINLQTGDHFTFSSFAPKPNPMPFGPPFVEAVPTSVRLFGNTLLTTCFTGFPFASGLSEVRRVEFDNGQSTVFRSGLTSAIDILPVIMPHNQQMLYVVEFSTNMLAQAPGRLLLKTPETDIVVANNLISPTSIARDGETGDLYITEIFPGLIVRIPGDEMPPVVREMKPAK